MERKGYGTYIPFEHAAFGCQGGKEGKQKKIPRIGRSSFFCHVSFRGKLCHAKKAQKYISGKLGSFEEEGGGKRQFCNLFLVDDKRGKG